MTTPCQKSTTEPTSETTSNEDHLVICWGNDGNISTSVANWIPPDNNPPPPASARTTKKLSKGHLHARDILGKYDDTAEMGSTKAIDLDGPRNAPLEYLPIVPGSQR